MNFFEIKYICAAFLGAAFCLAFFLRLRERGGGLKYIESFLLGVFSSLVVLLFNGIIHGAYIKAPVFLKAFLFAASVEKLAALAASARQADRAEHTVVGEDFLKHAKTRVGKDIGYTAHLKVKTQIGLV